MIGKTVSGYEQDGNVAEDGIGNQSRALLGPSTESKSKQNKYIYIYITKIGWLARVGCSPNLGFPCTVVENL